MQQNIDRGKSLIIKKISKTFQWLIDRGIYLVAKKIFKKACWLFTKEKISLFQCCYLVLSEINPFLHKQC
jgi:hypothetical protein